MKDYYKTETTALTPQRAAAVHTIANKLCAIRDRIDEKIWETNNNAAWVKTILYKWNSKKRCWDELREIFVGRSKSNSILAEAVHVTLPRQLKNCVFQLVVHGKRVRVYRYTF